MKGVLEMNIIMCIITYRDITVYLPLGGYVS